MERERNVYIAKLAEQTERYSEMAEAMKKVVQQHWELTVEERNLFSVAYKNHLGARRSAYRVLISCEAKENNKDRAQKVKEYKIKIEKELQDIIADVLDLVDNHLLSHTKENESCVFYHKMKGDYYRYMCELYADKKREEAAKQCLAAYETAHELASQLSLVNPVRLGLALNFAVFYFEILHEHMKSGEVAKKAVEDALPKLDALDEEEYKEVSVIMQLLWEYAKSKCTSSSASNDDTILLTE